MRSRNPGRCVLVVVVAAGSFAGCESTEDLMPIKVEPTPLAVDPLDNINVTGWWKSDARLLHLEPRGSYIAYHGDSRYNVIVERGQWARISYAHVTLEPFRVLDAETQRWTLTRPADRLVLVRGDEEFHELDGAPHSVEDDLIGTWSSSNQMLTLHPNMRYSWRRAGRVESGTPTETSGRWTIEGGAIVLTPEIEGQGPITVAIVRDSNVNADDDTDDDTDDEHTTLVTPAGELTHHDAN